MTTTPATGQTVHCPAGVFYPDRATTATVVRVVAAPSELLACVAVGRLEQAWLPVAWLGEA